MLPQSWNGSFGWQEGNAIERMVVPTNGSCMYSKITNNNQFMVLMNMERVPFRYAT